MTLEERLRFGEENEFGESVAFLEDLQFNRFSRTNDCEVVTPPYFMGLGDTPREALEDLRGQLEKQLAIISVLLSGEDEDE